MESGPEAIHQETVKSYLDELEAVEPGIYESVEDVDAWAAGLLHAVLMGGSAENKITIEEAAETVDSSEYAVGKRSRDFRHKTDNPSMDAIGNLLGIEEFGESDPSPENILSQMFSSFSSMGPEESELDEEDFLSLEGLTDEIATQVTVEGQFDIDQFVADHDLSDEERDEFVQHAQEGIEAYLDFLYESPNTVTTDWPLKERLGNPNPFGYVAMEVIKQGESDHLIEVCARYVLGLLLDVHRDPTLEPPHGSLIALGWLAEQGILRGEDLYRSLRIVLEDNHCMADHTREDARRISQAVAEDQTLSDEKRIGLLSHLIDRAGNTSNNHLPRQLFESIIEKSWLPEVLEEQFLEDLLFPKQRMGLIPPMPARSVRKKALTEMGNYREVRTLAETVFEKESGSSGTQSLLQGVPDLLREYISKSDRDDYRDLVDRGLEANSAKVRREFFDLAYKWYGEEVLDKALNDRADSIREWAEERK